MSSDSSPDIIITTLFFFFSFDLIDRPFISLTSSSFYFLHSANSLPVKKTAAIGLTLLSQYSLCSSLPLPLS